MIPHAFFRLAALKTNAEGFSTDRVLPGDIFLSMRLMAFVIHSRMNITAIPHSFGQTLYSARKATR